MKLKITLILVIFAITVTFINARRRKRPKRPHICDSTKEDRPKICKVLEKQCPERKTCKRIRLDGEMNDDLRRLSLKRLPDRVFWGYKQLTELLITDTDLERLPTHLPRNLKNLQLFNNKINYIPPGVFDELHELEKVYLTGNQLNSLSVWTFRNNVALQYLHLNDNQLEKIPYGFFDGPYDLKSLDLSRNNMSALDLGIFDELVKLEVLNLSHNKLQWVWSEQFINLTELKELYLNNNNITYLPENSFDNLVNIERLNIAENYDKFGTETKFPKELVAVCKESEKGCSFDI